MATAVLTELTQSPRVAQTRVASGPAARGDRARLTRAGQLFCDLLDRSLVDCQVTFVHGDDRFSAGNHSERSIATLTLSDQRFFTETLARGSLGMGECYMQHGFEVSKGTLAGFLEALLRNRVHKAVRHNYKLLADVLVVRLQNYLRSAEENIQFHYDLGPDLFQSFLDSTLTYSCGYAETPDDSVEALQQNKLDRICRKLRLREGDRLLDIGCGFAGLLIYAAQKHKIHGVGITLSRDQFEVGQRRIKEAGLGGLIQLQLRNQAVPWAREFDRVVSVGMLEHLPRSEYSRYFRNIAGALKPRGIGLVHVIGCNAKRNKHDPFIQRYVFPRSAQPRLSEMAGQLEKNGLLTLDVENMVRHYATTCDRWLENFDKNYASLPRDRYDERFRRMWQFYLSAGAAAARASDSSLYQVLFTNDPALDLPLRRV